MIKTILNSVDVKLLTKSFDVCWVKQFIEIDENGLEVIHHETPHRKAYGQNMMDEFLAEVEEAQRFIDLLEPKIEVTDGV